VSHNLFLGTILDQGIVGMFFLIGFLLFWFGEARRAWRTPHSLIIAIWKLAMVAINGICPGANRNFREVL